MFVDFTGRLHNICRRTPSPAVVRADRFFSPRAQAAVHGRPLGTRNWAVSKSLNWRSVKDKQSTWSLPPITHTQCTALSVPIGEARPLTLGSFVLQLGGRSRVLSPH